MRIDTVSSPETRMSFGMIAGRAGPAHGQLYYDAVHDDAVRGSIGSQMLILRPAGPHLLSVFL